MNKHRQYYRLWQKKNKLRLRKLAKISFMKNRIKLNKWNKKYYRKNKKSILQKNRIYYIKNRARILIKQRKYNIKNKQRISLKNKKRYLKNREKLLKYQKNYRKKNYSKVSLRERLYTRTHMKKRLEYRKNRMKIDIKYRLLEILRNRIHNFLKGTNKSQSTIKLLGCSIEKLKQHLEKQFKKGMNWSNYGSGKNGKGMQEWHIDHIIPCASFDLSNPSEQHKCFHYTNLQPLWARENLSKSDKIIK